MEAKHLVVFFLVSCVFLSICLQPASSQGLRWGREFKEEHPKIERVKSDFLRRKQMQRQFDDSIEKGKIFFLIVTKWIARQMSCILDVKHEQKSKAFFTEVSSNLFPERWVDLRKKYDIFVCKYWLTIESPWQGNCLVDSQISINLLLSSGLFLKYLLLMFNPKFNYFLNYNLSTLLCTMFVNWNTSHTCNMPQILKTCHFVSVFRLCKKL